MPKVVHFELSADDPKRAMKFYENVFGWKFQHWGDQKYWLASTGNEKEMGINGAIQPRRPESAPVVNTISVTHLDESIKKIEENGGRVITDKMEIPNVGTMVYFEDTEGNTHGLMQPLPNPRM